MSFQLKRRYEDMFGRSYEDLLSELGEASLGSQAELASSLAGLPDGPKERILASLARLQRSLSIPF